MTVSPATHISAHPKSPLLAIASGALLLAASACNGSSSQQGGNNTPGSIVTAPGGTSIIVDANNLGLATDLHISSTFWGRLVDVFGLDELGERTLMQHDFLIGPALVSSPGNFLLETSPVTGGQSLVIERDVTDTSPGGGRNQFFGFLRAAESNLAPLSDQGGGGGAGIFTMVPRNATIVIRFDDLLDPNLVTRTTIRVRTGSPATNIYDARVFVDPNHGDLVMVDGTMRFYPTRAYIDPTISEIESIEDNQGLAINTSGFPPSLDTNLANVALQIPTIEDFQTGQTSILKNRSGHELSTNLNGTVDFASPVVPVVRNFRSGGQQSVTGDPFNGFLPDTTAPRVVGSQGGFITSAPVQFAQDDEDEFTLPTYQFSTATCAQTPVVGDVISQPGIFAMVIEDALPPDVTGLVQNMRVRLLAYPPGFSEPADWIATAIGTATFLSAYDPIADTGKQACFVRVNPAANTAPATGIDTNSRFGVLFGEPMDRASFSAFDSLVLSRSLGTTNADLVIGRIEATLDLLRFTFIPAIPLAHASGQSEPYSLFLDPGQFPPTDLAGNTLETPLPPVTFTLQAGQNVQHNANHVTRFSAVDEEAPIGNVANGEAPQPEFSGQHFYDTTRGLIRPRAVTRFEAVTDRTQPVFALAIPANQGSSTPLSSSGSKLQAFWRPIDLNLTYDDSTRYNLDIEGLNWAPYQDLVSTDHFAAFEIRLAHGRFAPDEYVCPGPPAAVLFAASGVVSRFQDNLLSLTEDPLMVVHERFRGFSISPGQIFASATGTRMVPFPLNQDIPADQYKYYTWRDTGILSRGGVVASGPGVPLEVPPYIFHVAAGSMFDGTCLIGENNLLASDVRWEEDTIQSVALPLLMEFRCFPDNGASSSNMLDTTTTQNINFRPYFRAYSTGGVGATGSVEIDPDLESVANGGFNPSSIPANQATPGNDRVTYVGSMDLVVRISRSYSIWRRASESGSPGTNFLNPRYGVPVVEPENADQPNGTSIQIAMRGATAITNFDTSAGEARDALTLDAYGDWYAPMSNGNRSSVPANPRVQEFNGDASWHDPDPNVANPTGLDGAQYYQIRITFQANPVSGLVPSLSALGIIWQE